MSWWTWPVHMKPLHEEVEDLYRDEVNHLLQKHAPVPRITSTTGAGSSRFPNCDRREWIEDRGETLSTCASRDPTRSSSGGRGNGATGITTTRVLFPIDPPVCWSGCYLVRLRHILLRKHWYYWPIVPLFTNVNYHKWIMARLGAMHVHREKAKQWLN